MRIDEVLAQENAGGEVLWAIADHQGSVRLLMDDRGNVVNNITYDSFGNVTVETNAGTSFRFTYTGRELDPETGNYYYRSRLLDPLTGGFIQEDKIGFEGGDVNLSRYVGNSPLNYTDPYGENVYSILNTVDQGIAGFADTVTLGGSTWLRSKLYGDLATRNHEEAVFQAGQISGAVATTVVGFGTPDKIWKGLTWAQKLAQIHNVASTGIGAYDSTRNIIEGCGSLWDALSFAPLVGYGLSSDKVGDIFDSVSGLNKNFDVFSFKLSRSREVIQELPQSRYGHLGISFDGGNKIYGFNPDLSDISNLSPNEIHKAIKSRQAFPGKVTDDTVEIFDKAKKLGLNVERHSYEIGFSRYWKGRLKTKLDSVLSPLDSKRYMLPPKQGYFPPGCYNCATYPTSVGLPTPAQTGKLSKDL